MPNSISNDLKNNVLKLLNDGLSFRKISNKLLVSLGTISYVKNEALLDVSQNIGGAPCKISISAGRLIIRGFKTDQFKTIKEAISALKAMNIIVSNKTVRRMLNEAGMKAARKPKVLPLTANRKRVRLAWAKAHQSWTVDDWKQVIFSDETKINQIGSDGAQWFWNASNEEIRDCHLQHMYKHGSGSIMLWGCFL